MRTECLWGDTTYIVEIIGIPIHTTLLDKNEILRIIVE